MAIRSLLPVRGMGRLQRRLNRVFDEAFGEPFWEPLAEEAFTPACDVEETKTHYFVSFDLPGIKKEDVTIELEGGNLMVSGQRKLERKKEEEGGWVSRERYYGAFSRSFTLPTNVNAETIEANYDSGVLQIKIPKTAGAAGKQIPIKAA